MGLGIRVRVRGRVGVRVREAVGTVARLGGHAVTTEDLGGGPYEHVLDQH